MEYFSGKWLVILACAAGWTTFFSFFNKPGLRGYRNLGLLACYALGLVMLGNLAWRSALATWSLVGIASGFFYYLYEWGSYLTSKSEDKASIPKISTIFNGLFFWPIMLPEAIEYCLADLGVLKASPTRTGPPDDLPLETHPEARPIDEATASPVEPAEGDVGRS